MMVQEFKKIKNKGLGEYDQNNIKMHSEALLTKMRLMTSKNKCFDFFKKSKVDNKRLFEK